MTKASWRWADRDFGFRFRAGQGASKVDLYQAREAGTFYVVPAAHRKLDKKRADELAAAAKVVVAPSIVASPWRDYAREWDWISTNDGILLNFAGCLDREEIDRREDEGVARAMEFVTSLLQRPEQTRLTTSLIRRVHEELMGAIYPFAGAWRIVSLHKGDGPMKWPLPPGGVGQLMDVLERDVLSRSPFVSEDDAEVFAYVSEVMGEFLAIHPFREGNGRTAFILGNLLLMQNNLLPLDVYDRRMDEARYFAACEEARIRKDYKPLADLIAAWADAAYSRWETSLGR